ncbi:MAG: triphosphoribosyl-dephospho-CoA synthase [Schlesneria sp.]|nr:triphosphoribosyl-dephospho-CoA synthase [Schlesneria sp.]
MNLAEQIEISCLMEATARKVGNVHPGASFEDLCYDDFVSAAAAIAEPLAASQHVGLGRSVLNAIEQTHRESRSNVNLGIALLIAPLAAVALDQPEGIADVLSQTTIEDAEHVYAAIRLARPGGMGQVKSQDVHDRPTISLRDAMALAADRDRIAEQYSTNYAYVERLALPWLLDNWNWCHQLGSVIRQIDTLAGLPGLVPWEASVIRLQLKLLADGPDSLVVRKCGSTVAKELQERAAAVVRTDWPAHLEGWNALHRFDEWLRGDGHRRNPGTTADLIAATLLIAIRYDVIEPPTRDEVLQHAARIRQAPTEKPHHD